ncbi:MAG: HPF/RaiA family ribosome-associated protein [Bacteroidota bacterium]|nr:HPF/RaiA family ribosome-associated protein [Bacteroidota bacterium]
MELNHLDVSAELKETIETKVSKLEHFYENIVDAIVYLHDSKDHKEIEIKCIVKNDTLFVKEKGDTFASALDRAVEVMTRQIKKYKETTLKNN